MKGKTIIEVVVFFIVFSVLFRWSSFLLKDLGINLLWKNIIYGLIGVLLPLGMIWITKTDVGFRNWKRGIYIGTLVLWIGIVQTAGFISVMALGLDYNSIAAFGVLTVFVLFMIVSALFMFNRINDSKKVPYKVMLYILLASTLIPVIVVLAANKPVLPTIGWEIYFLVAIGFGEEILYRGYIQSRVNSEYGRPWKCCGVSFGPGLLVASMLFGLGHVMLLGTLELNWLFAIAAIFPGIFFGLVREKGGVIASFIFHAFWSFLPEPIMIAFGFM